jgi:hypothetical protein
MQYLSSVYLVNQPLHVSGIFVAHHQEVYCIYTTTGTCCIYTVYFLMMGDRGDTVVKVLRYKLEGYWFDSR